MRTRAREDLILAEQLVTTVAKEKPDVQKVYGGLCHSFPVLVRTCGLCQAVAFSEDKRTVTEGKVTGRNRAHQLLLEHVARILQVPGALDAARTPDTLQYMVYTRRVLAAWVYFKRFAVSILKVASPRAAEEDGDAG